MVSSKIPHIIFIQFKSYIRFFLIFLFSRIRFCNEIYISTSKIFWFIVHTSFLFSPSLMIFFSESKENWKSENHNLFKNLEEEMNSIEIKEGNESANQVNNFLLF